MTGHSPNWILALGAHQFDRTGPGFVPISLLKEIKNQAPEMSCEIASWNTSRTAIINRAVPPFDNPELRRAIMLALDRKAFINIIGEGQGEIGATMQPLPNGVWGMPADMLRTLPGYDPDIAKNREQAKQIMQKLGYWPDKRLAVTVTTRNVAAYRDPAVILIDQLKEIYIDGTLKAIDTTQWYPTVMRKEYALLRGKQDEKTYCLTEECSRDVSVASLSMLPLPHWPPAGPQLLFHFINQCLLMLALWSCGRRPCVVQAQRQIHRALRAALGIAEIIVRTIAEQPALIQPKPAFGKL